MKVKPATWEQVEELERDYGMCEEYQEAEDVYALIALARQEKERAERAEALVDKQVESAHVCDAHWADIESSGHHHDDPCPMCATEDEITRLRKERDQAVEAIEFALGGYEFMTWDDGELRYRHVKEKGAFLPAPESLIRLRAALGGGE